MHEDLCYADATDLALWIEAGEVSPVDVMRAHLARIDAINPQLNAIVTIVDGCLDEARKAEAAVMRGESRGPLHGVPFTIKEVFDTKNVRTTRGSRLFSGRVGKADATVVRRIREAGGILLGKTNCPEFALSAETTNTLFGRTVNPWDASRTSGGSSGGEAAAIAAGMSPLGVGSDLGGSNRLPSHYCGIVGFKATHGRVPLTGHWPQLMERYMHVGPLARSVRDVARVMAVISGADGVDPYAVPVPIPEFSHLGQALPPLRVGWFSEGPFKPVAAQVQEIVRKAAFQFEQLGCVVKPVTLSGWEKSLPIDVCYTMLVAEGTQYLEPYVEGKSEDISASIAGLMELPKPTLREYLDACADCQQYGRDLVELFARIDVLLCPTAPLVAHGHDACELVIDGQKAQPSHAASATVPFGLTGHPAISVPFGRSEDGMPIGVQLVAQRFNEATLLHAASALEATWQSQRLHPSL